MITERNRLTSYTTLWGYTYSYTSTNIENIKGQCYERTYDLQLLGVLVMLRQISKTSRDSVPNFSIPFFIKKNWATYQQAKTVFQHFSIAKQMRLHSQRLCQSQDNYFSFEKINWIKVKKKYFKTVKKCMSTNVVGGYIMTCVSILVNFADIKSAQF